MTIDKQLEVIFSNRLVSDLNGKIHPLESNVEPDEGEFITELLAKHPSTSSIEVGCAFGISSLYICRGLKDSPERKHVIVDPYQTTDWKGIGINNLNQAGVDFYELVEEKSEFALPAMAAAKKQFDFAFIDGWHTFDHTLIDLFYLNRVLKVGGIILIDDVGMPGINKVIRYFRNYPAYEYIGGVPLEKTRNRKLYNTFILKPFGFLTRILPKRLRNDLFSETVINPDSSLGIDCSMVAFKKIAQDERPWNWYAPF